MAMTAAQKQDAYKFFIVSFGAITGVEYMNQINDAYNAGLTTKEIVNIYSTKPQFEAIYPRFLSNEQFADKLIENVVGASATAEAKTQAKADVVAAINAGWSKGDVVFQIFTNLSNKAADDADWGKTAAMLNNKVEVAQYYTETLLVNSLDLSALGSPLQGVTDVASTVDAAKNNGSLNNGKTFTLTANADNIVGTSGDDLVTGVNNAQVTTFSAVDSIDGGAGFDTLKLELNAAYNGGAAIKNIEKLELTTTNTGGVFNTNGIAGLTNVAVNAGNATTFQNLANVVDAEISNTAVATTLQFANAAVAGATDKVTVTLDNVTGAAAVNVDSVTALGAGVEEVALASTGSANSVTLASNDATITKVTVSGDKNLTLALSAAGGNPALTATTIDASALTGNLTLSGLGIANHTVTGGSGNDTINFGANFAAGDVVDGGAGTDTLAVTQAITAAQWAGVKNVEAVAFTMGANVTQDASLLTGVNTFTTSGAFTQTLNKLANNADVTVAAATTTLTASLNDVTGLSDALKVQLNPSSGATANLTLGTLSDVAGIEQLNLVANGSSNAIVNTITTDSVVAKHVVTGAGSLTITNALATSLFDATGMTGNLTVTAAAGGSNIQAGSGNDVLIGGAGVDVLVGGAGNDRIVQTAAGGADTLKGGAGADTFVFSGTNLAATVAIGAAATATLDSITDFVAGTDKIALVNAAATGTSSVTVGQTVTIATAADIASLLTAIGNQVAASDNTTATAPVYSAATIVVQSGAAAGTYLFVNDATLAAGNTDMLINITGVSGTITANDFVFA